MRKTQIATSVILAVTLSAALTVAPAFAEQSVRHVAPATERAEAPTSLDHQVTSPPICALLGNFRR